MNPPASRIRFPITQFDSFAVWFNGAALALPIAVKSLTHSLVTILLITLVLFATVRVFAAPKMCLSLFETQTKETTKNPSRLRGLLDRFFPDKHQPKTQTAMEDPITPLEAELKRILQGLDVDRTRPSFARMVFNNTGSRHSNKQKNVSLEDIDGRKILVRDANMGWHSSWGTRALAPMGNVMNLIHYLGIAGAEFFGLRVLSETQIDVTDFLDQNFLDSRIGILRKKLGFFPRIVIVDGDIPTDQMLSHFAKAEIAVGREESILVHDLSYHLMMIFIGETLWRIIQKDASSVLLNDYTDNRSPIFGNEAEQLSFEIDTGFGNGLNLFLEKGSSNLAAMLTSKFSWAFGPEEANRLVAQCHREFLTNFLRFRRSAAQGLLNQQN